MAATVLTHRIGDGSTYDIDMDLIERFIKSFQHPENKINRDGLKFYYLGALYAYWYKLREYLNSGQPEKDIAASVRFNRSEAFTSNPGPYDQRLSLSNLAQSRAYLPQIQQEFENIVAEAAKMDFSLKWIWDAFYFMSNLFCLKGLLARDMNIKDLVRNVYQINVGSLPIDLSFEEYYSTHQDRFYPLVNNTGFFSPNTYLYAYFQGVDLIGVPSQNNDIEGFEVACPTPFLYHDFDHQFRMWRDLTLEEIDKWRTLYYLILNDSNLIRIEKELHILYIFIGLHEIVTSAEGFYSDSPGLEALSASIVKEYASEFEKFAKELPLFDSDLIQYLFSLDVPFEQSGEMTDEWEINSWKDLENVWDLPDYHPLVLYLLSAAYSIRYVREHYF